MAIQRVLEINIVEHDTEELDTNNMGVHRQIRHVRVDISDTVVPPESAMQSVAFQAKMEYARQSAKASRAAKKMASSAKTMVAEVVKKRVKLSDAQFVALLWVTKCGDGRLHPWPGGFWTIGDMKSKPKTKWQDHHVPMWYTTTSTVVAMATHGLLQRANDDYSVPKYRATHIVTDLGRRALEVAEAAGQRALAEKKWNLAADLKLFDEYNYVSIEVKKGIESL